MKFIKIWEDVSFRLIMVRSEKIWYYGEQKLITKVRFLIYDFLSLPWFFEPQWLFKYLEKFNKIGIAGKPLPSGI